MIHGNAGRFGAIRTLTLVGSLTIGLAASTAVPAFAGRSGTWTKTGSLNVARGEETATLLANGQVLVAGGADYNWNGYASAELYNPVTGKWTFTGSMNSPRLYHTATLLPNGQVLVVGGPRAWRVGRPLRSPAPSCTTPRPAHGRPLAA